MAGSRTRPFRRLSLSAGVVGLTFTSRPRRRLFSGSRTIRWFRSVRTKPELHRNQPGMRNDQLRQFGNVPGTKASRVSGNADRGEDLARRVANWCCDTSPVRFMFVIIDGVTVGPDLGEFLQQPLRVGDGILGKGAQSEADDAVDDRLRLKRQRSLADAGAVAGRRFHPRDGVVGTCTLLGVLDKHHLEAVEDAQVNRLAAQLRQGLDEWPRFPIKRQVGDRGIAKLEQLQSETISLATCFLLQEAH
jgi:hypothetical protein